MHSFRVMKNMAKLRFHIKRKATIVCWMKYTNSKKKSLTAAKLLTTSNLSYRPTITTPIKHCPRSTNLTVFAKRQFSHHQLLISNIELK
jgi:hypothetical protein